MVQASLAQLPHVQQWVDSNGWKPDEVDLVINMGHIGSLSSATFVSFVAHSLKSLAGPWRSVTLASAAAPKDYSELPLGRSLVKRSDWALWSNVYAQVPYKLDYGDYGISHPDMTEAPGAAMARASVSVRYTINDEWIIVKGNSTGGPKGQPMNHQFPAHAKILAGHAQFGGLTTSCWGDQRVSHIASLTPGSPGSGSRGTWVAIGANRHLALVAERLP